MLSPLSTSYLLSQAINELNNLNPGEEFLLKDLFKGYEWKRIKIGDRMTLGTLFLYYVQSDSTSGARTLSKTSSNQQIYVKL